MSCGGAVASTRVTNPTIAIDFDARNRRRPRRRRLARAALALVLALLLVVLGAVLFRDAIARRLLPRLVGPALGLDVSIDRVEISIDGHVVLRGVSGENPAEWTPWRRLRADAVEADVSIGRLLAGADLLSAIESA